jgi:hypothetical protein
VVSHTLGHGVGEMPYLVLRCAPLEPVALSTASVTHEGPLSVRGKWALSQDVQNCHPVVGVRSYLVSVIQAKNRHQIVMKSEIVCRSTVVAGLLLNG